MRAVADTGPLFDAISKREPAHEAAAELVALMGRGLVVLGWVAAELDYLVRRRVGAHAARAFARSLADGVHQFVPGSQGLLERAVEIDSRHADLGLGLVDASVMAYAERHDLPILTFDFKHFRAARPQRGAWRLVMSEDQYRRVLA